MFENWNNWKRVTRGDTTSRDQEKITKSKEIKRV